MMEYGKPFATADGGYLLAGVSESNASGEKSENSRGIMTWVVKVDRNGNKLWGQNLGGTGKEQLESVAQVADGGHLLAKDFPVRLERGQKPGQSRGQGFLGCQDRREWNQALG